MKQNLKTVSDLRDVVNSRILTSFNYALTFVPSTSVVSTAPWT
jgi:hypothetical protein